MITIDELRQQILDHCDNHKPEIEVDLSRGTKTLYKWAVRNYDFPSLSPEEYESIFPIKAVKPKENIIEVNSQQEQINREFTDLNNLEDEIIEKNIKTSDKEKIIKSEIAEIKEELKKDPEETTKNNNKAIWWGLAIVALIAAIYGLTKLFGNHEEN
jgi:Glu-tRNA(Gln) amidotransferase subunit E-like FAD-binding protein